MGQYVYASATSGENPEISYTKLFYVNYSVKIGFSDRNIVRIANQDNLSRVTAAVTASKSLQDKLQQATNMFLDPDQFWSDFNYQNLLK